MRLFCWCAYGDPRIGNVDPAGQIVIRFGMLRPDPFLAESGLRVHPTPASFRKK